MRLVKLLIGSIFLSVMLLGCVNNAERFGAHVTKLKTEQIYNSSATQENLGVVPTGSGERMEGAYQVYTGKQDSELKGTDSQFIEGFSE
ncbi:hypothetical protein NM22_10355 [Vibrio tubiashii]|nr:hypothetical protein NM22_10355 [Vibrio tubiashii]